MTTQVNTDEPPSITTFEEFYERYRPLVRAVISRNWVKGEDVEDLTQIVFLKAWQSNQYATVPSQKNWISLIARNTAYDFHRSGYQQQELHRRQIEDTDLEALIADESAEEERAMCEESDTIDAAFTSLPSEDQQVMGLLLREYHKSEIREALNLTELEMRARVKRARRRFIHHYNGDLANEQRASVAIRR